MTARLTPEELAPEARAELEKIRYKHDRLHAAADRLAEALGQVERLAEYEVEHAECNASVYTITDDDWQAWVIRDLAHSALAAYREATKP